MCARVVSAAALLTFWLFLSIDLLGSSFTVNPTQVVLTARTMSALLTLRNDSDEALRFELSMFSWDQTDSGEMRLTSSEDIVFFPPANDEDIYLCLEAKRLNAAVSGVRRSLADEYVREGMQRFVDGKYARFVRHGAMLGYVLDGNTDRAMKNVENNIRTRLTELRMDKNDGFLASSIRPDDPRSKETRHRRAHEATIFRIHHLFMAGDRNGSPRRRSRLGPVS